MAGNISRKGKKDHPLPVGRDMREPVIPLVGRKLLLPGAIRAHPPDLHLPGALGVEVDILAVWRVLRSVVEALGRRQTSLRAAIDPDRVNIKFAVALPGERQSPPIG